jgi:hypothetical protein
MFVCMLCFECFLSGWTYNPDIYTDAVTSAPESLVLPPHKQEGTLYVCGQTGVASGLSGKTLWTVVSHTHMIRNCTPSVVALAR